MKKLKVLFVLIVLIMAGKSALAQETIITDISEEYIARLVARAEANYPLVKSNQSKIDEAQDNIGKARVGYLNVFTFSYIYQPQGINTLSGASSSSSSGNSNYSYFNGIQAGIFFNLGSFLAVPYAVKQARHELEIAKYDQNTYYLTLTNQVKARYYAYVGDIAILKFTTQTTADAQSILLDVKHRFEKGEETFDNYTKAQTSLTTTYQAKIQAETALLIAKANLEELLGEKLENIR
jgi:outer membrane protein TolC